MMYNMYVIQILFSLSRGLIDRQSFVNALAALVSSDKVENQESQSEHVQQEADPNGPPIQGKSVKELAVVENDPKK